MNALLNCIAIIKVVLLSIETENLNLRRALPSLTKEKKGCRKSTRASESQPGKNIAELTKNIVAVQDPFKNPLTPLSPTPTPSSTPVAEASSKSVAGIVSLLQVSLLQLLVGLAISSKSPCERSAWRFVCDR
ncbi:hypothetical protein CEXT_457931 [Caerostris extrusa]|uniref:Uncharacterized protein n=1 Tax=Caerostris extrusa TaxID=172846 RepID=A0AAV4TBJ6_CAEEX|nr:hypothetical protein CEXT_457931 [Caerostris extrusa]